ncbi:MAG: hypothetical protein WAO12_04385 [Venatoribacter sp.]
MSLIVEIAGMFGGMLAEYASSKKWSKLKTFFAASCCFFTLFAAYVLLFPSDRGVFFGILIAICLGGVLGLCCIGIMHYHEKHKK